MMGLESLDPTLATSIITAHAWLPGAEINSPTLHGMENCHVTLVGTVAYSRTTVSGVGGRRHGSLGYQHQRHRATIRGIREGLFLLRAVPFNTFWTTLIHSMCKQACN
jgi:hypothetical protein